MKIFNANSKRTFRGFLIRPRQQLRQAYYLTAIGLFGILALSVVGLLNNAHVVERVDILYRLDEETLEYLRSHLFRGVLFMVAAGFFSLITLFVFTISLGHRFFGPIVPMSAHIDRLIAGNYSSRVHLRKGDELHELADKLNQLAETLEKK